MQRLDKPAERHPSIELVLARELRDVKDVGQRLFATWPQHEPHVRARGVEQGRDRLRNRPAVALRMQRGDERQGIAYGGQMRRQRGGDPEGMKAPSEVVIFEQV